MAKRQVMPRPQPSADVLTPEIIDRVLRDAVKTVREVEAQWFRSTRLPADAATLRIR